MLAHMHRQFVFFKSTSVSYFPRLPLIPLPPPLSVLISNYIKYHLLSSNAQKLVVLLKEWIRFLGEITSKQTLVHSFLSLSHTLNGALACLNLVCLSCMTFILWFVVPRCFIFSDWFGLWPMWLNFPSSIKWCIPFFFDDVGNPFACSILKKKKKKQFYNDRWCMNLLVWMILLLVCWHNKRIL